VSVRIRACRTIADFQEKHKQLAKKMKESCIKMKEVQEDQVACVSQLNSDLEMVGTQLNRDITSQRKELTSHERQLHALRKDLEGLVQQLQGVKSDVDSLAACAEKMEKSVQQSVQNSQAQTDRKLEALAAELSAKIEGAMEAMQDHVKSEVKGMGKQITRLSDKLDFTTKETDKRLTSLAVEGERRGQTVLDSVDKRLCVAVKQVEGRAEEASRLLKEHVGSSLASHKSSTDAAIAQVGGWIDY
jgi:chromosome segregation ATPase